MSLEQLLQENTAALLKLAAVLGTASDNKQPAAEPKQKPPRVADRLPLPEEAPAPAAAPENDVFRPTFDEIKVAFQKLSMEKEGRARCVALLKSFGIERLSGAKPEQYFAIHDAIAQAAAQ